MHVRGNLIIYPFCTRAVVANQVSPSMKEFVSKGLFFLVSLSLVSASHDSVEDDPVVECAVLVRERKFTLALEACQRALGIVLPLRLP